MPDGSLRASGANPDGDTYTVVARTSLAEIRAIRLEALPDPSLPAEGTGRGAAGRFVLSRFGAEVASDVEEKAPVGRFVRVELPGKAKILSLAEVEVYSEGTNVALGGAAEQSSTDYAGAAARAIDGKTDGRYSLASSTTHTRAEDNPWWEVRLAEPAAIERISVWNRTDKGVEDRLAKFRVQVLDDDRKVVWQTEVAEPPKPQRELSTAGPRALAFARVRADFAQPGFDIAGIIDPKAGRGEIGLGGFAPAEGATRGRLRAQPAARRPLAGASDLPPRASLESAGRQPRPVPARGHQRPRRGPLGRRAARGAGGPRHARGRTHRRAARGARPPLSLDRARAEAAPRRDRRGWSDRGRRSRTCRSWKSCPPTSGA